MRLFVCSYFSLVILIFSPVSALAIPAITCHCFKDRAYDPARPAIADPYFLATTQNSFFAVAFGVDKKTVVMKKQKGVSAEDLWIAYWLAARSGADPETLLQSRKTRGSWRNVATPLGISASTMGRRFAEALQANATDALLANAVVDELLLRFRFYGEAELTALRKAAAGNQELILAAMISFRTRQPALQAYLEVKNGSRSWGTLLDRARINPAEIHSMIESRINRST